MKDKLIGLFLVLLGLTLLPISALELRDNMATKAPTPLAWAQFVADKPEAGWFKVSGAQLEVADALWVEDTRNGEMGNIYVPARAAGNESDEEKPIEMLVRVDDPKIAQTVRELQEIDKGSDEAAMKYTLSHLEQLIVARPLVGTIAEGMDDVDSDDKNLIEKADITLASDFVILQEGEKPSLVARLIMLLVSIGLTALGLFYLIWKKTAPPAAPPTASGFPSLSK